MSYFPVPDGRPALLASLSSFCQTMVLSGQRPIQEVLYTSPGVRHALHRVVVRRPAGEYRLVEYYRNDQPGSPKVLDVRIAYNRGPTGIALSRWVHRRWYCEQGAVVAEKWTHKRYSHDPQLQAAEGHRRRQSLIDEIMLTTLGLLTEHETGGDQAAAQAILVPYTQGYGDQIDHFVRTADMSALVDGITNDTDSWLDTWTDPPGNTVSVRAAILSLFVPITAVPAEGWTAEVLAGDPELTA